MKSFIVVFMVFIVFIIVYVLAFGGRSIEPETFTDFSEYTLRETSEDIFDTFYATEYDELFKSYRNIEPVISNILHYTIEEDQKNNPKILDIGCGTGLYLQALGKHSFNLVGIDNSESMLKIAETNSESSKLVKGDFHERDLFKLREFSHILCCFLTIYYSDDVEKLFKNANYWLRMGGFFCIHLLERAPISTTKLKLNNYNCITTWAKDGEYDIFEENFLFNDKKRLIKNRHMLKIKPLGFYINLGKKQGFKIFKKIDLSPNSFGKNNLLIFKKQHGP